MEIKLELTCIAKTKRTKTLGNKNLIVLLKTRLYLEKKKYFNNVQSIRFRKTDHDRAKKLLMFYKSNKNNLYS